MSKPSGLPEWNSAGTNNVAPSAGRKSTGFVTGGDSPDSTEMNWWFEKVYRWIKFWDDASNAVAEAIAWVGAHTFAAGITVTQSTSNTDAIAATGNGTGDGIQATSSGAGAGGRFSSTSGNAIDVGTGNAKFSGSNPPSPSTAFTNTMTPANVPKVLFKVGVTVGDGVGNWSGNVLGGFNLTSITRIDATTVRITFASAFATSEYFPVMNISYHGTGSVVACVPRYRVYNASYMEFNIMHGDTALNLDSYTLSGANDFRITGGVFGLQ